jgi:hypothetical protein
MTPRKKRKSGGQSLVHDPDTVLFDSHGEDYQAETNTPLKGKKSKVKKNSYSKVPFC